MSEESVEAIFQHACEGAAESIGSTRTDWQRVADAIRELRRELAATKQWGADLSNELTHRTTKLAEARRLLDDARAQKPVAYMHNKRADVIHTSVKSLLSDFAVNSGPESMLRPIDKSEHYTIPLYATPVPAQPAAVPEAVAEGVCKHCEKIVGTELAKRCAASQSATGGAT
jgi:hypothetical protein